MTNFRRLAIASIGILLCLVSSYTVDSSSTIGAKGRYRMYGAGGKRAFFTDFAENDKVTESEVVSDLQVLLMDIKAYADVLLSRLAQIQQEDSTRTEYKKWQIN